MCLMKFSQRLEQSLMVLPEGDQRVCIWMLTFIDDPQNTGWENLPDVMDMLTVLHVQKEKTKLGVKEVNSG